MPVPERVMARLWERFREKVVPPAAGPHQVKSMKMAFYAGATSLLQTMMYGLESGTSECTPADEALMDGIHRELDAFAEEQRQEAARASATRN